MSALARYTRPIDGTIPVQALLYDDESLLASQDGVGLYDGPNKAPAHQSGTVHVTSHRLFFIAGAFSSSPLDAPSPTDERGASISLQLEAVSHTESYAGFFKSSPKVTLHLRPINLDVETESPSGPHIVAPQPLVGSALAHPTPVPAVSEANGALSSNFGASSSTDSPFESWECEICGYRNPPGLSPSARSSCGLCGMPRDVTSSATPSAVTPHPSSSDASPSRTPASGTLPVSVPNPALVKNASSSITSGASHLLSKSLPSSSASTPAPVVFSPLPMTQEESLEGERRRRKRKPSAIACTVCTFLNHPYLRECEMCGEPLQMLSQSSVERSTDATSDPTHSIGGTGLTPHVISKSAPSSRPVSPALGEARTLVDVDEKERYIKLSFRKGGDKAFYAALKTALQQKEWEVRDKNWKANGQQSQGPSGLSGISAILQNIDTTALHTEQGMSDAFEDLEALMPKAQDMVRLAKGLNEQLSSASRSAGEPLEPEEATFVRSSLGQLGLNMKNTAVTADMSNDEQKYYEQLAIELTGVLEGANSDGDGRGKTQERKTGIMRKRGIVGLDEVWGGWNRARGVALISPEVTLKVLPFLAKYTTPPIKTRVLKSGLRVLHTPAYSTSAFSARFVAQLVESGPRTTTRIAGNEELSVGLVEELVSEVEDRGDICREDPMTAITTGATMAIELKWWPNAFVGYSWDGQVD